MAEQLKDQFGPEIITAIAGEIAAAYPSFATDAFIRDATAGFEGLALKQRAGKVATAMHRHLPAMYEEAVEVLIASLSEPLAETEGNGTAPFRYWPHTIFVAEQGLEHFAVSMRAQYELTQRFTAEFSIRPFLQRHPEATLAQLRAWACDANPHVRRLVSEGTRPRLPNFQRDPAPVLELLELLKDDQSLYVRRSVANNLNDIGKDHPKLLAKTAKRWLEDATLEREWIVRHALRSAIKRGEPDALAVLGYGVAAQVQIENISILPRQANIGKSLTITFDLLNTETRQQRLLVDFRIHFVKANGKTSPKVFKLKTLNLAPGASAKLQKRVSLAEMSTRKHYAGRHEIEVLINGTPQPLGEFQLREA
ncbi:MAG: DNA alkylation repair protein [Zetaproteobacteria bacterium CG_4_9_14_3_um_filter_49_83]|nr:MAG: DNA alkylation repair protein [Zetaproteobacteria bacterium CG1_02_49_23]PIQ33760.1 MAG: DNA alkylation repair protein [Zetaproteobacteria bacterium CG17_big_fil_post_rev_8_21_14_2_50_50_13]PIV30738.1 MAG: DNA alkylation repair protein [Zetaproteobacteria bacterium CG02_land_8_20_14_3_00_50_9]PIY55078.1 MAG: DNA alkylation repair protein [Zetaproteobacteria bacterium CG_4_10_14_0_8_um_filter_49_80]PJA36545.1 MAG: DNA alkylation repair protein [Zetaproteobacteria bacterium CG_4_9_14_3_um